MIEAAAKKKGPLKLPVKRLELPDDVQVLLSRMEKEASEDFLSCGMDACIDFQVLLGMGLRYADEDGFGDAVHAKRIQFLGEMIRREKNRLETKEKLKLMFAVGSVGMTEVNGTSHDESDHFG